MLKKGQVIGMVRGDRGVDLLVSIRDIAGDEMQGYVINGNWYFSYSLSTHRLLIDNKLGSDNVIDGVKVIYTDPIPMHANYNTCNEAIAYMNDHLNRWFVASWVLRTWDGIRRSVTRFYKRFKTSSQMFMRTWKNESTDIKYVDIDDDIPF